MFALLINMRSRYASAVQYTDLIRIYCGDKPKLPPELCMLCLQIAGLCGHAKKCTFFWVYF